MHIPPIIAEYRLRENRIRWIFEELSPRICHAAPGQIEENGFAFHILAPPWVSTIVRNEGRIIQYTYQDWLAQQNNATRVL
jgi:hypothetical protein